MCETELQSLDVELSPVASRCHLEAQHQCTGISDSLTLPKAVPVRATTGTTKGAP